MGDARGSGSVSVSRAADVIAYSHVGAELARRAKTEALIILRTTEQQARSPLTRWPIALDVFRTLIEHESVGRSQVEANVL